MPPYNFPSVRASCDRCQIHKLKCIVNAEDKSVQQKCTRCIRPKVECVYSKRARPKRQNNLESEGSSGEGEMGLLTPPNGSGEEASFDNFDSSYTDRLARYLGHAEHRGLWSPTGRVKNDIWQLRTDIVRRSVCEREWAACVLHARRSTEPDSCISQPQGSHGCTHKNAGNELLLLPAPPVLLVLTHFETYLRMTLPAFTGELPSHNAAGVKTLQLGGLPLTDEVSSRLGTAVKLMLVALRSTEDMLGLSDYASTTRRFRKADPCGCSFSAGLTKRGQDITPLAYEELLEVFKDHAIMGYKGAHMDNLASKVESVKTMLKDRIDLRI
ncbi:hypothetical protein ACHAO8_002216 [Botrytis cinerea]